MISTDETAERFRLRPLEVGDYRRGYLKLLEQLTQVGDYDEGTWQERFQDLASQPNTYRVVVIEDTTTMGVVGSATLFVELKFIRGASKCGHIEDVVVDSTSRGHGLGLRLIEALMALAEEAGCYKVILDCSEGNAPFYARAGFTRKEVQMVKYF